jgi:hypothetical protein
MPDELAGDGQGPVPADQFRPIPKSKSAALPLLRVLSPLTRVLAPLLRVLSRPNLIARTIPFIPAYPASSALKTPTAAGRHCVADPEPDESEPKGESAPSPVPAKLDDLPIHIRPFIPAITECEAKEPFRFGPLRRAQGGTAVHSIATDCSQKVSRAKR